MKVLSFCQLNLNKLLRVSLILTLILFFGKIILPVEAKMVGLAIHSTGARNPVHNYINFGDLADVRNDQHSVKTIQITPLVDIPVTTISDVITMGTPTLGSLRQAIIDANKTPGSRITFQIPGTGIQTISLSTDLDPITASNTIIDGTTQPGFAGAPLIELDGGVRSGGTPSTANNGLVINASHVTIRGLIFNGIGFVGIRGDNAAISIQSGSFNIIQGNLIGTDIKIFPASINSNGIIINNSSDNIVGGTNTEDRNVILSNNSYGIEIRGSLATGNKIQGNYIGIKADGLNATSNPNSTGIFLRSPGNIVGGTNVGEGNVISGNFNYGIIMGGGITVKNNLVQGNYIGTDKTGTKSLPNSVGGISLTDSVSNNTIGGITVDARNIISGNKVWGVLMSGSGSENKIQGNYIGTDVTGAVSLGNGTTGSATLGGGVGILNSSSNLIGRLNVAGGNLISGNNQYGIVLSNSDSNTIFSNYIGTDSTGSTGLMNNKDGVYLLGSSKNLIGSFDIGGFIPYNGTNIIAFNGSNGVLIDQGSNNGIFQNSIFSNTGVGIKLVNNGNNSQVAASINSVDSATGEVKVSLTDVTNKNASFIIEFFSNVSCAKAGEGQTFLGYSLVKTDSTGVVDFSFIAPLPVAALGITSTATLVTQSGSDIYSNSSVFSLCK